MLTTEHRPVPLPPRHVAGAARRPLPDGAVGCSKTWVDAAGLPQRTDYPVPVDTEDRRTAHVRHVCRGKIEVNGVVQPCDRDDWALPGAPVRFCPDHGVQLGPEAAPKREGVPWSKVWDVLDERLRAAGVVVAVGAGGALLNESDFPWWGEAAQIAALPAVVVSSWWLTRWYLTRKAVKDDKLDPDDEIAGKRRRRLIDKRARTAGYIAALGAGWIEFADLLGVDPTTTEGLSLWAALAALGVVGSRPYRRYADARRAVNRPVLPFAELDPTDDQPAPSADYGVERAAQWLLHAPNGAVANTRLLAETWREVVGGWGIIIQAIVPGAVDTDMLTDASAKGKLRVIAGTFGLPKKAFNFVETDDPNQVLMLVQPNPPLAEGQVWEGPESINVEKGVARTGRRIDGSPMYEPFYKYGWGAPSKIVTGTTGSGKSENLRKQMIIERYFAFRNPQGRMQGMFATFLHDPKHFESYGEFRRALHASGTTLDDAIIMRDALIREMDRRYAFLSSMRWTDKKNRAREGGLKWDPRVHGPILSWVIDEFHELAKILAFVGPLELLARKMRACGIRVTIGTHLGTLGDTGSRGFRDMLAGGYALLGRTTDGLTSVITGGQLTADPRQLPKLPGMCLVADGEQQTMHARQSYIPADEDEPMNVYDLLFDDDNNPIGYPAVLPPETLEAFGEEWVQWADAGKQAGGRQAGMWVPKGSVDTGGTDGQPAAGEVTAAKDAVLSILMGADGPLNIDGIDAALRPFRERGVKCGTSMARKVLAELVDKDKVAFKPKHGFYQILPHVQEDLLSQLDEGAGDQ